MPAPWNNWFHCMGSTYGAWLRGDPRGWRERHHHEHVEGDYKHPPPEGVGFEAFARSKRSMKRPSVRLTWEQRIIVCRAMVEALQFHHAEVIDLAMTATHFHALVRFRPLQSPGTPVPGAPATEPPISQSLQDGRDPLPRVVLGKAKSWAVHQFKLAGQDYRGGIWAARTKLEPITSREHQISVVRYIRDHVNEGGAVWSLIAPI